MKRLILSIPKGVLSIIMILMVAFFTLARNPLGIDKLNVFPYAEQVGHFILYFIATLVFIMDYAIARLPHHSHFNIEVAITAAAATLGLLMEIALLYRTNGVNYDINNWFAAIAGAVAGLAVYRWWLYHPLRHYLYHSVQHHWRYSRFN